jgi:hypothetical protein
MAVVILPTSQKRDVGHPTVAEGLLRDDGRNKQPLQQILRFAKYDKHP